jgi:hypothetical protein
VAKGVPKEDECEDFSNVTNLQKHLVGRQQLKEDNKKGLRYESGMVRTHVSKIDKSKGEIARVILTNPEQVHYA